MMRSERTSYESRERVNRYGKLADEYWRQQLPSHFSALADPEAYFTELGDRIQREVSSLAEQIVGPDRVADSKRAKLLRLRGARVRAEREVIADLVWNGPQVDGADEDSADQTQRDASTAGSDDAL
jgi:hypothetical protein